MPKSNIRRRLRDDSKRHFSAPQVILIGFAALILAGALLLTLPISSAGGQFTSPRTALFTAVSASCVTGLVVVDTGTYWSTFGHAVIITMIQIGGLGFMTMAVMLSIFLRRQISPRERMLAAQSLGLSSFGGTVSLVRRILAGTFIIEGVGALLLASQFIPVFGVGRGIWYGVFHSISAFCNAGFDLLGGYGGQFCSFTCFADNPVVAVTLMLLIVLGGIGFVVWDDLLNLIVRRKRLSVYSKFVLIVSGLLIFVGAVLIALFEWNNPATLASLPAGEKLMQALFQSVTTRTAGIDMINNAAMTESSQLVSMLLMLVGGASGSTAGGIKVGTFGVLVCAMLTFARGERDVVFMKRKVSHETIIRALSITGIDLALALSAALLIAGTSSAGLIPALYDAVSAIATVGLSLSLTPTVSLAGHIALMVMMFFGRVGILTFTYSILLRQAKKKSCITYPEIDMMIG
ncbi:MAG: hypothetical protein IJ493_08105 [Clostridia bacterium]|nr:hypothetical protein [Clostridia bacterium]